MLESMTSGFGMSRQETLDGLTAEYAMKVEASAKVGDSGISDYEYELQMAPAEPQPIQSGNGFLMPAEIFYVSSRLVREVAQLGGNITVLSPELVAQLVRVWIQRPSSWMSSARQKASERKAGPGKEIMSSVMTPVTHPVRSTSVLPIEPVHHGRRGGSRECASRY
jgi:hypothetical protein